VIANREENRREDVEALQAAGISVWVTFPKTVQEALNLLWTMMDVFDAPSMVPRVRLIEQTVDFVERIGMTRSQPCRVFVPIWYDPLMTFNADTYIHDLVRVCGGSNVFADRERRYPLDADLGLAQPYAEDDSRAIGRDTRYPRVTIDEVVAAQPDVILLPSEPFAFTAEHVHLFEHLDVPAAHHGAIHLCDGSLLTWHGTRIAHALTVLPALFCSTEENQYVG
jgi:ABC-type Fe3+-hydroxamate transport system substrate-binding protein